MELRIILDAQTETVVLDSTSLPLFLTSYHEQKSQALTRRPLNNKQKINNISLVHVHVLVGGHCYFQTSTDEITKLQVIVIVISTKRVL